MKILVIPTWYPNGIDKLMGIYHKEFCEALSKIDNIKVDMLYIDLQRIKEPFKYLFMNKKEIISEKGYKVYIIKMLDIKKKNYKLQINIYTKKLEKLYLEYLKTNEPPDIIHAEVTIPAGYAACKLGKKYNIPVLVTEHASFFKSFFEGKNKEYGSYVLANSTFTTVSNYMAKYMENLTSNVEVLPNLIDTNIFKKERNKITSLRLVTVSAFRQGKNIENILEALKILTKDYSDVKLTIVGDGYLEKNYKNKCHELNLDQYVTFTGRKTKAEIADILNQNNIFVISSIKETFCIPGLEALASGIPVVATKCLGPEEYLDKTCGELVPINDPIALANAIKKVYQNLDKYDIDHLRSIADKYSANAVTSKAIKIYKKLNKGR